MSSVDHVGRLVVVVEAPGAQGEAVVARGEHGVVTAVGAGRKRELGVEAAVPEHTDTRIGTERALLDDREAPAHRLTDPDADRVGHRRETVGERPVGQRVADVRDGCRVGGGDDAEGESLGVGGRAALAHEEVVATHEDPAAPRVPARLPAARPVGDVAEPVGHVEGEVLPAVAAARKAKAHDRG